MTGSGIPPRPPLPESAYAEPEARRRRAGWGWLIALVIVAGLAVAAWFLGEWIARGLVTTAIRDQVATSLALPADQEVDVALAGTVIPQLIAGRLDDVIVSADDVSLSDALTADVVVHATGVQLRGDASADSAAATVTLDEAQVRTLMSTVAGFPADTLGLRDSRVTITTELVLFTARFPIGVGLAPTARAGVLVLSPAALQLGDAQIDAEDLRDRFGGLADLVLRDWDVCIAQYLPAAVSLTAVAVERDVLVADLAIDAAIVSDPALRENGTCD